MPVASWYVDSPNLIVKAFRENVSPYTAIFLWDKGYIRDMESMGFESVTYLPLGTDERIFRPLVRRGKRGKALACEVGFVGNSMVRPTDDRMANVDRELHPVVERLAQACLRKRASFDELLNVLADEDRTRVAALGSSARMNFEAAVLWKTTQRYRLQCIQELCSFDLRVHGDAGWRALVDKQEILHSPLDYYKELPTCYNACKINFNATSLQMGGAVNQRVFDVPACGAFLLTDHQEALDEAFDVGREVVAFEHPEEIPGLVRFYLDHPADRHAIAERGRARVLKEHTYQHRLRFILERMRARYGP
jgi:spore maturation protein CgeB